MIWKAEPRTILNFLGERFEVLRQLYRARS